MPRDIRNKDKTPTNNSQDVRDMTSTFQTTLDHLRSISDTTVQQGRLFERLMKAYLSKDALYKDRFSTVQLWGEWAATQSGFDSTDIGIDLVAKERAGGHCAIQCKCHARGTTISKSHIDSFVSASNRKPFTSRIIIDTGDDWGPNARKAISGLKPECQVLRFGDLASRPVDWPDLVQDLPENLAVRAEPFELRLHQKSAIEDVRNGFDNHDRGKLIMACGTGKTFTALRIAEMIAGTGGTVLYLVPSISLLAQTMREWATQKDIPHSYIGICSDTRTGHTDEDAPIQELEIPVTTDVSKVCDALKDSRKDVMTVVFSTYQSLPKVEEAQKNGAPEFDIAICDEAHRTTGVERPNDKTSPFVLVHNGQRILSRKRLYMTATPRLYTGGAKAKAAKHNVEVFSMDDPETYGPEFHRLSFSKSIEQNLLSDYKVVVLAMSEQSADKTLRNYIADGNSKINITDATKVIGCWRVLQNPENVQLNQYLTHENTPPPSPQLSRAIAFTNTIASSKRLEKHWDNLIQHAIELLPENDKSKKFQSEVQHVDGQHNALARKTRLEWLEDSESKSCRILTNAKCLSEGIDVPALDAVLFLEPRKSHVDVVQSVGRVMRKSEHKKFGYIVLPVAVPPGTEPSKMLDDDSRFAVVWSVLRALRSHDDRFNAEVNQIDLNEKKNSRFIFFKETGTTDYLDLPFPPIDIPPGELYAKIVEKCGDRKYWQNWAKDVADIYTRLVERIRNLLDNSQNEILPEWFNGFLEELKSSINNSVTRENAIEMMAQHILTQPVFDALFEHYNFAKSNPVANALDALRQDFGEFGLENEIRDLESFYESVQLRAQGLDNSEARQRVLMELYENFFTIAMKKDTERLGIVYTPIEVVDFIVNSVDDVLRSELKRSLSDRNVHVLDPFAGTGIFLVRLLQSGLIRESDLNRKYRSELHANEIVLLAYYIATVHIEESFHGQFGEESEYEPFNGMVLTDTFNLHTNKTGFPKSWLPDNSARVEHQQNRKIQVIIGNPPWSVGQKNATQNNPNVAYPEIENRVKQTYAARTKVTNKNSLYDYYKMAIRWASDRIEDQGVVAFVTNGSWIDGLADAGIRACLNEEFSLIYVLNLRGNQRTQGETSRSEGGKVFGQGSRAPVAITVLVRNPDKSFEECQIYYHDIGDYRTRDEKLKILRDTKSVNGISSWQRIRPDQHNDWINQRSDIFQKYVPIGSGLVKSGKSDDAIFCLYSNGLKTGKDGYMCNYSQEKCIESATNMVENYSQAIEELGNSSESRRNIESAARNNSTHIKWDRELKNNLKRSKSIKFDPSKISLMQYRPFVKQFLYNEKVLIQMNYRIESIYPNPSSENHVICVSGVGSKQPFSVLIVNQIPDLGLLSACQCFPLYRYYSVADGQLRGIDSEQKRVDNITDTSLRKFRVHYQNSSITKEMIFDYVYGILHSPKYQIEFMSDLSKELPRIPFARNFHEFSNAGHKLIELHLNYDSCSEYPLNLEIPQQRELSTDIYKIQKPMRFAGSEKTTLEINEFAKLHGIPSKAHDYQVKGRTPLEWFIDRYQIRKDKDSGITNDPNDWFTDPFELIQAIRRIVYVSVESAKIIQNLPEPFDSD